MDCGDLLYEAHNQCESCKNKNMCPAKPHLDKIYEIQDKLAKSVTSGIRTGLSNLIDRGS